MKKLSVFAMLVIIGTSVAVAASLAVPWFVDNAAPKSGIPHADKGVTGLINLKSNRTDTVTCKIAYYSQEGYFLGPPDDGVSNTFTIAPRSALAFRPVISDPDPTVCGAIGSEAPCPTGTTNSANNGGQEGWQGFKVPNRPTSVDGAPIPGSDDGEGNEVVDVKKNGSITISWAGDPTDVQGFTAYFQTSAERLTMSYAHLLPTGI